MSWFELLLLPENLLWAWRKVRRSYHLADGLFDQAEVAAFELNLEAELASIRNDFETGSWNNQPIRLVPQPKKPDKDGKPRLRQYFEIAVRDQVAWTALVNVLGPELDQKMPAWSYGNRLYRAAWYEEKTAEGRRSKLNIGPYRHSAGYLYRHFKHSWPLFRRHISLTARKMVGERIDQDELDPGERLALEQSEGLAYFHPNYWSRPASSGETLYVASLDLRKFYPSIRIAAIENGFADFVEDYSKEPRLRALVSNMLCFVVDDAGLSSELKANVDPPAPPGAFDGIPTGLFVGGFLANVAMLPIDSEVDQILLTSRDIGHFRFVDDHEILAFDFDQLLGWIAEYSRLLEGHGIGAQIEYDKYKPIELKWLLHPDLPDPPLPEDDLRLAAIKASSVNGRKPTELMTRTLAQVSMLAGTDFDLLTDAGRGQRLEQLEWLLLANIPDQEIRGDTRMAFAAARIAGLTPGLYRPNEELMLKHRHLKALMRGAVSGDTGLPAIKEAKDRIEKLETEEREAWETLVKRNFGLLFEAFATHPEKVRLFTRLLDYCRVTGHNGFQRLHQWMREHREGDFRFLSCYLGALALHALSRHILTASVALARSDLLHRERRAAHAFLSNIANTDLEHFVPMAHTADQLQRFQWHARRAFTTALFFGGIEAADADADLGGAMMARALSAPPGDVPPFGELYGSTGVPLGVWLHWFFAVTGAYRFEAPPYWRLAAAAHEPARREDWNSLRRFPTLLPRAAWARLGQDPHLLSSDDEGWLLDAARATPQVFAGLSTAAPVIADVRARIDTSQTTLSLVEWVDQTRKMNPSDPRRSEWTALEIMRHILALLAEPEGPDPDFLDRLHPADIRIPASWHILPDEVRTGGAITWEAWRSLAQRDPVIVGQGLRDFRYHEVLADDRSWYRRVRALGQILWGVLRQSFMMPSAWNIRGQERSLIELVARDVERLPISSFTISILQACLLPRSRETLLLEQFPMLFGNLRHQSANDTEFDRRIGDADQLRTAIDQAQAILQESQMTVLEHKPRQLIPVRLRQMGAFVSGQPGDEELDI